MYGSRMARVFGCQHGRPPGRPCPHCLGIGAGSIPKAVETFVSELESRREQDAARARVDEALVVIASIVVVALVVIAILGG